MAIIYMSKQAGIESPRQADARKLLDLTPAMVEAGVEIFREWLNEPANYIAIQEGGIGNAADLITRVLRHSRK